MSIVSPRISQIKTPPGGVARALIAELRAQGRDVIDLTIGEPDFSTPEHICQAAHAAIDRGDTHYKPTQGTVELRTAISVSVSRQYGLEFSPAQVSVSNGAKQVIANAFAATLDEGDEVIVPAPYWTSYPEMARLHRGTPVIVDCSVESGYKLTAEQLEQAITPNTKWLVMNNPGNPTGAVYDAAELAAINQVLLRHPHVWLLTDDIYVELSYLDEPIVHHLQLDPSLASRTLLVNGVSKTYAMTGWRIGYGVGPVELIKAMTLLQLQCTSGASSISQAAALAAITGPQDCVAEFRAIYRERRDVAVALLKQIPGIRFATPGGAFYVFIDCTGLLGRTTPKGTVLRDDLDVVAYLLSEAGVSVLNGQAYGVAGSVRLAFTNSLDNVRRACEQIVAACQKLS